MLDVDWSSDSSRSPIIVAHDLHVYPIGRVYIIHTYMHTYIHTHIRTCIHTYTHLRTKYQKYSSVSSRDIDDMVLKKKCVSVLYFYIYI